MESKTIIVETLTEPAQTKTISVNVLPTENLPKTISVNVTGGQEEKPKAKSKLVRHGHAVGDLRGAFCDWVDDPDAELNVHGQPVTIQWVLGQLWNCTDVLPGAMYSELEMTGQQTYAAAVRKIKAEQGQE